MGCAQQALLVGSAAPKVYATWNPADKSAGVTLSGGNLSAAGNAGNAAVRSTIGKSSGKWYWELTVTSSAGFRSELGIMTSAAGLNSLVGADAFGWGYFSNGSSSLKFHSGSGAAYGASYAAGDVIGVALDMDAGTIEFFKNNVSQGVAYSSISGSLFAAASFVNNSSCTANFGATPLSYAPPAGFNAGLYE